MIRIIGAGILILAFCGLAQADYIDTRTLEISAEGVDKLKIDCGAGYLDVEGVEDTEMIIVEAEIVIEGVSKSKAEEYVEDNMTLTLEKKRNYVELESGFESSSSIFGNLFSHGNKLINLTVKVPSNLILNIDDGSGWIYVQAIDNDVSIDDGSGEMEIENIIGNLNIDDGSGEIRVDNVEGDLEISDGSGEINIRDIDGDVILSDGSGSIYVNGVSKDVEVIDDGSGSCRIKNVEGHVYEP
jgi:DUF4097 and DUF4098 domain-containing protein YvlB